MKDYISAAQAAKKWATHIRSVQECCQSGRIPGARKLGRAWLIPADAQKPLDPRRQRRLQKSAPRYLGCVLLAAVTPMSKADPAAAVAGLPDAARRAQLAAEFAYLRGDFQAVKEYYAGVSPRESTYLCAANIALCAAMSTRDYPLFRRISAGAQEIEATAESPEDRRAASLLPVLAAVSMNAPQLAPEWLRRCELSAFAPEALPTLLYMRARYLQSAGEYGAMLAAAQTARSVYARESSFTLADIYLSCLCACASYALGRAEDTRLYLDESVALCRGGGFVSPLGEYTACLGGMLELALGRSDPAFERAVRAHIEATQKNWLFFHNEFTRDKVTLILSTREYQLAVLLKEGKTYRQAAEQLCLSVGRIRNLVTVIYGKLGISKKSDIVGYIY